MIHEATPAVVYVIPASQSDVFVFEWSRDCYTQSYGKPQYLVCALWFPAMVFLLRLRGPGMDPFFVWNLTPPLPDWICFRSHGIPWEATFDVCMLYWEQSIAIYTSGGIFDSCLSGPANVEEICQ